ncbi:acyltransferase [Thermobifida fusca]|uniref:Putative acyltransferase n=2 Tax=Thermobifida fusca TaxID=2021 RepID=Q47M31_THEFY|nr:MULTISPECIES: acyltransferase [Thermobifida]AAZ56491.1 putative acyltransferase [Thermobifida fusca YX]MBO2530449.1 acyltransferase [Thermobifida sp.]PPS93873.1 acyltransferase [Thermobifida fusca]PZN61212.1 MAG: acyltransferase [Thermobifida fusca]QOS58961.1 acyltransferase [Thermobifida fusca]
MTTALSRSANTALPQVSGHQPALEGMRALAALLVLLFHVAMETGDALAPGVGGALLAGGDMAVPLFFALSGLLLYRPWANAAIDGEPGPSVRSYLRRRAARILPAYWLVAVVALLLWSREHLGTPRAWLEILTLTFIYDPAPWWTGTGPRGLGQMWSLCVEVAFYVLLPLLAVGLAMLAARGSDPEGRARILLTGVAVLPVLSLAALVIQFFPEPRLHLHAWPPRALGLFAVGMALAVLARWAWWERDAAGPVRRFCQTLAASPGLCWSVAAAAYLLGCTPLTGDRFRGAEDFWAGVAELLVTMVFAFFLIAPLALLPQEPTARPSWLRTFLEHRTMRFLGRVSYGIFLWQFVVLYLWRDVTNQEAFTGFFPLDLVPVAAGTILLAAATYYWVEQPIMARVTRRPDASATPEPADADRATAPQR